MSGNSGKLNALIAVGGLSLPASTMLTNISLDSTASFGTLYFFVLAVGAGLFALSLITLYTQKHDPAQVVWQILSVGVAAGVFVAWTRYESFYFSIFAVALVVGGIAAAAYFMRPTLADRYKRKRVPIYIALALVTLVPTAIAVQNIGPQPLVTISPPSLEPAAYVWQDSPNANISLTVKASQANAEQVTITVASPTNSLPVSLNDTRGPCEIGYLKRTETTSCMMTIVALPTVQYMTWYNVTLTATYNNAFGQSLQNTFDFPVYTGPPSAPVPPVTYYWFSGSIMLSVIAGGIYYLYFVFKRRY